MTAITQVKSWGDEAADEVVGYLRDNRSLRRIVKRIIDARHSIDAAALELEALAIVTAAARTPYHSVGIKETGIDSTFLGPRIAQYERHIYEEHEEYEEATKRYIRSTTERIRYYNVYIRFRFIGDFYIPIVEFVFIDDSCYYCADLLVSVEPAGLPAHDPLRAVRRVIWSAAKEPTE
jgi:hypothetical protein